jgi:DDE_Tnp_1-associated
MAARKLGSLFTHSQALEDPRLERSRLHNLLDVIATTLCAVICGADSWADVEKYGIAKHDWLKGFLELPGPTH